MPVRPLLLILLLLLPNALRAAEAPSPEAKLREALRNTMLQLRTMQTERDNLQIAKDQAEQEKQTLSDKLDILTKQTAADQQATEKLLAEARSKLADQELATARLRESLEKWKASQKEAVTLATTKEAARAKLAAQAIDLQRHVDDQQRKNAELFRLGSEILSRYEKFGLGTAITAREPFVGAARVKLQTLAQDYSDQLAAQKIKP